MSVLNTCFLKCSATEILRDATLTVAYSFEGNILDSGPMGINGSGASFSYFNAGRVNRSLGLLVNASYVQATGLVLLGTSSQPYSISIWIRPTIVNRGTIMHVSGVRTGLGWCIPMLGFTSAGAINAHGWNGSPVVISGPSVVANVWTHLAVTYSPSNGLRLYVNGTQRGASSAPYGYTAANLPVTLTLGSSLNGIGFCSPGSITMGQYYGYMDEFQLYSRELTASAVLDLTNL